jgi:hypothetical protein
MKQYVLACGLALSLAACGGGGSSTANTTTPPDTLTGISNPTSPTYTGSLKAVAETWTGGDLAGVLSDLAVIAGATGNCGTSGTASFTNTTQTVTKCLRKYPAGEAYSGTYTVAGTSSAGTISNFSVQALDPSTLGNATPTIAYKVTGGSVSGGVTTGSTGVETTNLTSGSATFTIGSSVYTLSNLNTQTTNDGSSILFGMNGIQPITFSIQKGTTSYDVYVDQSIKTIGSARPSSGQVTVTYATTTACSPLRMRFISNTQFGMTCVKDSTGTEQVKNWTDADVLAALKTAQQ